MKRTSIFCDRSGKPIEGERGVLPPGTTGHVVVSVSGPCDLFVHCPWLPAVHGLRFDDLCDEDRRVLVPLLLRIARKTKHQDEYMAGAVGYSGGPLGTGDEAKVAGGDQLPLSGDQPVLHKCASPSCPGLPWKASDQRHPCGETDAIREQTLRDQRNARALDLAAGGGDVASVAETLRAEEPGLGAGASMDVATWAVESIRRGRVKLDADPALDET